MRQNWEIRRLSTLCDTFADGDWIEKKDQSDSGIRLVQTGNIGNGIYRNKDGSKKFISQKTFERLRCTEVVPGDILVSRLPDPVGRSCIIPPTEEIMITAVDCTIIRLKPGCLADYLVYYTQSTEYNNSVLKASTGSTRQRISRKNLGEIQIPIPPLSEQQRIVDILNAEFARIDALKDNAAKNLQNAKDMFQAALKKELEPKEGWVRRKLNDIYDVRDGTHDSPKYYLTGHPLVTSKNLRNGVVDLDNVKLISKQDYDKINERSKVDIGDVLFAMIGTIGNPCLVEDEPNYAIKNMALFKVPKNQSGKLLKYILSTDIVLNEMRGQSKGSNQPFVSLGYLRNFTITIPASLDEQVRLAAKLDDLSDKCNTLQSNYQKTLILCDDLKQALLWKAFNGDL